MKSTFRLGMVFFVYGGLWVYLTIIAIHDYIYDVLENNDTDVEKLI